MIDRLTPFDLGSKTARRSLFVLRIAIAALLVWLIIRSLGGTKALTEAMSLLPVWMILAALAVNTFDRLLMTYKWILLLHAQDIRISLLRGTQIYCASMVWGMFLPATVGADMVRVISTSSKGIARTTILASVVVERALGFMASLLFGLIGLAIVSAMGSLPDRLAPVWWICAGLLLIGLVAVTLSFSERSYALIHEYVLSRIRDNWLLKRLRMLHRNYHAYRSLPGRLILFLALSFLEQLVPVVAVWIVAQGLGLELSFLYLVGVLAISLLVARIPITPGGIGIMEGSLTLLLAAAGIPPPKAMALALTTRLIEIISWVPWWSAFVVSRGTLRRPRQEESIES